MPDFMKLAEMALDNSEGDSRYEGWANDQRQKAQIMALLAIAQEIRKLNEITLHLAGYEVVPTTPYTKK